MTIFDEAIRFAVEKHSGMVRKGESTPYILHPMEVAAIVGTISSDEDLLAAAVLHDTVEDTDATLEEIRQRFGPRVAMLVASETEDKRRSISPHESWRVRKEESLAELRRAVDPAVRILWLGDKLSNMRSFYRVWRVRGDRIWESFNQNDPVQQAWYYRSIDAILSDLRSYDAWQEFHRLVNTIFPDVDI